MKRMPLRVQIRMAQLMKDGMSEFGASLKATAEDNERRMNRMRAKWAAREEGTVAL